MTFTAIDFETATGYRNSICQVGLVRVVDGVITEQMEMLVQPPDNYYWSQFTNDIHGISAKTTRHVSTFNSVWPVIEPFITGQLVVAHNAVFDCGCLNKTLEHYRLQVPQYQSQCTYRLYGTALNVACKQHGIALQHHNALSDAHACAQLYLLHLRSKKTA